MMTSAIPHAKQESMCPHQILVLVLDPDQIGKEEKFVLLPILTIAVVSFPASAC